MLFTSIDHFSKKILAPLRSANKSTKEQVQRAKEQEYKGLPESPPNGAHNTKTNIVVDVVALAPKDAAARRGTAVPRIDEPRPAPEHSLSWFIK